MELCDKCKQEYDRNNGEILVKDMCDACKRKLMEAFEEVN